MRKRPADGEWSWTSKLFWIALALGAGVAWGVAYHGSLSGLLGGDFLQDWASARNFFAGLPLYTDLREAVRLHTGATYHGGLEVNAHPPVSVLLVLPFGRLDYRTAFLAWELLWLASLPLTLWCALRELGVAAPGWTLLATGALLLVSRPLEEELVQGQFNLFLLELLSFAWIAQRRGRSGLSGALVGSAAAVKLFPAFVLAYFLGRRDWRALIGAAVAFTALNTLALGLFGWETFAAFVRDVIPQGRVNDESWRNYAVRSVFAKLFDAHLFALPIHPSAWLARGGPIVVSAWVTGVVLCRSARADSPIARQRAFASCTIGLLLVSPIVWEHYLLLLTLPLLLLWFELHREPRGRAFLIATILLLAIPRPEFVWDQAARWLGEFPVVNGRRVALPIHTLTVLSYPLYAVLALFLFTWFRAEPRSDETASLER